MLRPVCAARSSRQIVLIGFGSTKGGAIAEAVSRLNKSGTKARGGVHLPQVFPLPDSLGEILMGGPGEKYVVESNVSGQLQALIASRFAWKPRGGTCVVMMAGRLMPPLIS